MHNPTNRLAAFGFLSLLTLMLGSACAEGVPPPRRGEIVRTTALSTMTRDDLDAFVARIELPGLDAARTGIEFHRIEYWTPDVDGTLTVASGLVVVPTDLSGPLPILSDQHGTQIERRATISDPLFETELGLVALLFASQGYLVVGADYLGLGVSAGLHPYHHAATEASACVDMLRAARTFFAARDVATSGQLFLSGYSQGGHVTMALHREIEHHHAGELEVTASAPMAGAYDLANVSIPLAIERPAALSSFYLAYGILAYERVYDVYASPSEIFRAPYDARVESLFDGTHAAEEIRAALPGSPSDLLRPDFVAAFLADPDHSLRARFAENEVYDWRPEAPVRLYHGRADVDVPIANAEAAYARMTALGADVQLVDVGADLTHETAALPSYLAAKAWFDTMR